ncbi:MAG: hypothetical protein V4556_04060 [Bacteroidota bacterium]
MKYLFFFILSSIAACHQTASERVAKELKNHLQPKDNIINKLELGKTFVLESSEVQGIDHERYKEFDYWKEIDKNYFEYVTSKEFSNPDENGGSATTLEIQKAIKKGYTEVRFYKRNYYGNKILSDTLQKDTARILYNTYKFNIE